VQPAPTTPKQSQALPPVPAAPAPNTAAAPSLPPPTEPTLKQASPAPADPVLKQATPAQPSAPASKGPAEVPPPAAPAALAPAPAVSACQDTLSRIATAGHILFATDSASLDASSLDTLDRLAVAAKTCPGMRIAIEGHTDAEGSSDYNQRLSVRRAQAVVAYLVKAGADRRQLEAVGYGVSRPAAPNDTPQNMARNRRIEFSVRQQ
jgi:outer membrane protein OmpA-like peptidoglycan-associated protein